MFLKETFAKEKTKSFNDPVFRLNLIKIKLVTDLFPKPIRELLFNVETTKTMTEYEKYIFVAKAEISVLQFILNIKLHEKENADLAKLLTEIGKLQRQCNAKNRAATLDSCNNINIGKW